MEKDRTAGSDAYAEHCKKMGKPNDPLADRTTVEDGSIPPLEEVDP
jgi:hypothetical protein